jgi:hypothetical protein
MTVAQGLFMALEAPVMIIKINISKPFPRLSDQNF